MTATALRFQIGARTLVSVPRRLHRVSLSLDEALAARAPALPSLRPGEHGYLITSLPEAALPALRMGGLIEHVRQRYRRYFVDLSAGEAAWRAGLSANARAQIKRKAKKLGAGRRTLLKAGGVRLKVTIARNARSKVRRLTGKTLTLRVRVTTASATTTATRKVKLKR